MGQPELGPGAQQPTETTHFHYFNPISFYELFRNTFEIVGIFNNDLEETGKGPTLLGVIKNKMEQS